MHGDLTVFISHNSANKNIAREIGLYLLSEDNINVWFDEWEIDYGESIPEKVNVGLGACTHFLLLWSMEASESHWVERERNSMLHKMMSSKNKNLKIIPILLDNTPLPMILADFLSVKYSDGSEEDRYKVIKAVTGGAPSRNLIAAIVKKYNELIFDNESGDVFSVNACPKCGSQELKRQTAIDDERDEIYYVVNCKKCNWSDWTQ